MIQNIGNVNLLTNGFSHYHNNEFKKIEIAFTQSNF